MARREGLLLHEAVISLGKKPRQRAADRGTHLQNRSTRGEAWDVQVCKVQEKRQPLPEQGEKWKLWGVQNEIQMQKADDRPCKGKQAKPQTTQVPTDKRSPEKLE